MTGKRVGIVTEGFNFPDMEEDVAMAVRTAALRFKDAGVTVEEVSVPIHSDGRLSMHFVTVSLTLVKV